jgi:hypothetical protein
MRILVLAAALAWAQNQTGPVPNSLEGMMCYRANKDIADAKAKLAAEAEAKRTLGGISSRFLGKVTGLGSWFRANHGQDNTNGNSWCGYGYSDSDPIFAPELSVMTDGTLAVWGTNPAKWEQSAKKYCGLEAIITNPHNGRTVVAYIGDAFEPKYVRTPGAIDVMIGIYRTLTGMTDWNKNNVVHNIQWELTGKKSAYFSFKRQG